MNKFENISDWFGQLIYDDYRIGEYGLALYRIGFALYLLIFGLPVFYWIHANPDTFFAPPEYSLTTYFQGFPSHEFLLLLDLAIILLIVFLLFGYKTVWTSLFLSSLWLIGFSFKYSFGKIDHNILFVITPLIMSVSGWGRRLSLDKKTSITNNKPFKNTGLPIFLLAVMLGFGYFTAGYAKVFNWMDFNINTHGVRNWVVNATYLSRNPPLLVNQFIQITNPYFWELMDIVAVTFELSFFIAVFNKKMFRSYLLVGVMFHFTNLLMLNIAFLSLMIVYLLFIEWDYIKERVNLNFIQHLISYKNLVIILLIYWSTYLAIIFFSSTEILFSFGFIKLISFPFLDDPQYLTRYLVMSIAVIVALFSAYNMYANSKISRALFYPIQYFRN